MDGQGTQVGTARCRPNAAVGFFRGRQGKLAPQLADAHAGTGCHASEHARTRPPATAVPFDSSLRVAPPEDETPSIQYFWTAAPLKQAGARSEAGRGVRLPAAVRRRRWQAAGALAAQRRWQGRCASPSAAAGGRHAGGACLPAIAPVNPGKTGGFTVTLRTLLAKSAPTMVGGEGATICVRGEARGQGSERQSAKQHVLVLSQHALCNGSRRTPQPAGAPGRAAQSPG